MEGRHEEQALLGPDPMCFQPGLVEIGSEFDQFRPKSTHRGILFDRIAVGRIDDGAQTGGARGAGLGLAVVAARGGDDARGVGVGTAQPVDEGYTPADLEGAGGTMVFVFDPDFRAGPCFQLRPSVLRGWVHLAVDQMRGVFEFSCGEHHAAPAEDWPWRRVVNVL